MRASDLSSRDMSQYWSDCVVIDKDNGDSWFVVSSGDRVVLRRMRDGNSAEYTKGAFLKGFHTDRYRLGWRNVSSGCVYGYASPGRHHKKSYIIEDITLISPILSNVTDNYSDIKRDLIQDIKDPIEGRQTINDQLRSVLDTIDKLGRVFNSREAYFKHINVPFTSIDEAIDLIDNRRVVGRAINYTWSIIRTGYDDVFVYCEDMVAGRVVDKSVVFNDNCKSLEPAWNRIAA